MRTSLASLLALLAPCAASAQNAPPRPNVVLVMTDDQGFGDFGFAGNPVIRTPNLDALAADSARLASFYVSPVCTPTRSALMTGRWAQRTRAFDTYIGRAMMEPDEVTVAEILRDAGYATAIFGKWHLGDCHPMRAIDQGFEVALVHRGGGIGQPSDPPGGEAHYTDPILFRNGVAEQAHGYCTDVYFREALAWMRAEHAAGRSFFCYIATNAPHGPFGDVPDELRRRYLADGLGPERFPVVEPGHPLPAKVDEDRLARIYAMIENVDDNIGRLLAGLRAMDCLDDTLLLFLVDNGPEGRRYVAGHRGAKSEPYEGGIHSPLLAHWPGRLAPGVASDRIAAHIDILPTILDACGAPPPAGLTLDGRSLLPLLERRDDPWPDRTLVLQANRGDTPVPFHNVAIRSQRWKLVNATGFGREVDHVDERFELYDMAADPLELRDVARDNPDVVAALRTDYLRWWDSITATRPDPFAPPRIFIGTDAEPVTTLTHQDWRRDDDLRGWGMRGTWLVDVRRAGRYAITVRLPARRRGAELTFRCGDVERTIAVPGATDELRFELDLPAGPAALRTSLDDDAGRYGAHQIELRRL
ncbi:MAG: arylsulfatase [Planctomycetes bacterium]|nr:arylsulfatase [Planctomycetota bacterium]